MRAMPLKKRIKTAGFSYVDGSPGLLDLCDRDLPIDAIGIESDLVADFDLLEHGRILDAKDHRHPFVHVELFDWPMPKSDFARGCIDLGDLTVDQGGLGHGRVCEHPA